MSDNIELRVGSTAIKNWLSYTIEADIYTADDAFSLELAHPETDVTAGKRCELYVNGTLELTGIIDRVNKSYDKSGQKLRVEGRDLMGLLVDSYCEEFFTLQGHDGEVPGGAPPFAHTLYQPGRRSSTRKTLPGA